MIVHDDVDRIMAVMLAAFDPFHGEAWTRGQVENALLLGSCRYLLIAPGGEAPAQDEPAAGFAMLRAALDEEELLLFAVRPEARRRGLGARLLAQALAGAKAAGMRRMLLEMRRGNDAGRLYENAGFLPIGLRPRYYRAGDGSRLDAITYARDID
jgi:ribosomal-protein-alanine N-acetyltransferase